MWGFIGVLFLIAFVVHFWYIIVPLFVVLVFANVMSNTSVARRKRRLHRQKQQMATRRNRELARQRERRMKQARRKPTPSKSSEHLPSSLLKYLTPEDRAWFKQYSAELPRPTEKKMRVRRSVKPTASYGDEWWGYSGDLLND